MQACRKCETDSGDEGIGEVQAAQVEIAIVAQEGVDLILLGAEAGEGVGERDR